MTNASTIVMDAVARATATGFAKIDLQFCTTEDIVRVLRRSANVTFRHLKVTDSLAARPNSLSVKYGIGRFPFHTDFAFRPVPARFIVLINETKGSFERPTLISRIADLPGYAIELLTASRWSILNKNDGLLLSGLAPWSRSKFWRVDFDFLQPENHPAELCCNVIPPEMAERCSEVTWSPETAVLIDNWNCAHAREQCDTNDVNDRKLTRLEVWENARVDR